MNIALLDLPKKRMWAGLSFICLRLLASVLWAVISSSLGSKLSASGSGVGGGRALGSCEEVDACFSRSESQLSFSKWPPSSCVKSASGHSCAKVMHKLPIGECANKSEAGLPCVGVFPSFEVCFRGSQRTCGVI